jgi:hypothetical protein
VTAVLELDRARVLGHRRRTGALDSRRPYSPGSLRTAAWAGLQDSVPRAAVLSLHARVEGVQPDAWEDPSLVQVWGPRHAVFVVAAEDRAVFTLGTLPDEPAKRARAARLADLLEAHLAGGHEEYATAGRVIGVDPNALRYAGATGRVLVRWDGARRPRVETVPAPDTDPWAARLELARRYLHVCGPVTPEGLAWFMGLRPALARAVLAALDPELVPVRTPLGDAWLLAADADDAAALPGPPVAVRILSSGDPYLVAHDRPLLVPDEARRHELWPSGTVWPGGLMVDGELVGSWRRSGRRMTISAWRLLSPGEREAVEQEAASLPLPDQGTGMAITWTR